MTAELLDETAALARGKYVSENVRNFMLDGEVVGNYDMILADRWEKHVLRQKAERDGCCNELGPMSNGRCRKFCYVMCPLWEAFVVTCGAEPLLFSEGASMDVSDYVSGGAFLKAQDLRGKKVKVTIAEVRRHEFTKDGNEIEMKLVLVFDGKDKSLVCNKLNARVIEQAFGTETDAWVGHEILLYPAKVDFRGQMVDAIRVEIAVPEAKDDIPF